MGGQSKDLSHIFQRYKARVIRVIPVEDYYLVETNRGPKELREWPRLDILRWSFQWREHLARRGFRNVQRFIRTRDTKPYVVHGKKGYTLTDHIRRVTPYSPSLQQASYCGRMVAKMHEAQNSQAFPIATELLKREQASLMEQVQQAKQLHQEFVTKEIFPTDQTKWVASQFRPLLERMERSTQLLQGSILNEDLLGVSHRQLGRENWSLVNNQVYLRGFYRPALSVQHRDTAAFLRQIYLEEGDTAKIDAFLEGYQEEKPITYQDYALMLVFMAYPFELWKKLEAAMWVPQLDDTYIQPLEESIRQQQRIEPLLQHLAHRAEQGGRSHEQI